MNISIKKQFKKIMARKKRLSEHIRKLKSRLPTEKQIQTRLESGLYFIPKRIYRRIPKSKRLNEFLRNKCQEGTKLNIIVKYGTPYLSLYVIKRTLRIRSNRLHSMNARPLLQLRFFVLDHPFLQPYVRMGYYAYLAWHGVIILQGWRDLYFSWNSYQEPQATIRYFTRPIDRFGLNIYPRVVGWTPITPINLGWFLLLEDLLEDLQSLEELIELEPISDYQRWRSLLTKLCKQVFLNDPSGPKRPKGPIIVWGI